MSARYCQDCGTPAEAAATFCASCGARLAEPPRAGIPAPGVPATLDAASTGGPTGAPAPPARHLLALGGVAVVAAVIVLAGGAIVVDRLGRPAGPPPASPSAGVVASPTSPAGVAGSPDTPSGSPAPGSDGPSRTDGPVAGPTAVPAPDATPAPSFAVGETPIAAVGAFLEAVGRPFTGRWCEQTDPVADAGSYCAQLFEDRGSLQVVWVGLVGSEPDTWLLVAAGQYGWAVLEWSPVEGPDPTPPF